MIGRPTPPRISLFIDEVDIENRLVHGFDRAGGRTIATFHDVDDLLPIPDTQEFWVAELVEHSWRLTARVSTTEDNEAISELSPGDRRIAATGAIYLEGTELYFNGDVVGSGGGGASDLDDLTDVVITAPASTEVLQYNGTNWVNSLLSWTEIDGKPATFAPSAHTHAFGDITGTIAAGQYGAGTIVNADISGTAGIALSKLAVDPLARANHTGTQLAATISDFDAATLAAILAADGSGSGLDADLLDGQNGSFYATDSLVVHLAGAETISGAKKFSADPEIEKANPRLILDASSGTAGVNYQISAVTAWQELATADTFVLHSPVAVADFLEVTRTTGIFDILPDDASSTTDAKVAGQTIWHAGNDGAGSGLDADLLDGQNGAFYATDSLVVHLAGAETITGAKTFTANVVIDKATATLRLDTDAATQGRLEFYENGAARWTLFKTGAADDMELYNEGAAATTWKASLTTNIVDFTNTPTVGGAALALASAVTDHTGDATDAHDASAISVLDAAGNFTGVDVEAVLEELFDAIASGGISPTIVDGKGELIVASAADAVDNLAVGANDTILMAASGEALGLKWASIVNANIDAAAAIAVTKLANAGAGAIRLLGTNAGNTNVFDTLDNWGVVDKTSAQTISGLKTFSAGILVDEASGDSELTLDANGTNEARVNFTDDGAAGFSLSFDATSGVLSLERNGTIVWSANESTGIVDFNEIPTKDGTNLIVDPLTTRGDLIYRNATVPARLAVGADGTYLRSDGTDPGWAGPPSTMYFQHLAFSPVDATTYYFGPWRTLAPATAAGSRPQNAMRAGKVRAAQFSWLGLTASGTAENISLYVRNITAGTEELVATVGSAAQVKSFANYAMTLAVAQGDIIEAKLVCPTWVTNPTGVDITGHILIA
jgi:hypothetical protein